MMLRSLLQTLKRKFPSLILVIQIMCFLVPVLVFGSFFDQRTLLGESVWIKPLKFDLSLIVFLASFGGILAFWTDTRAARYANLAWILALIELGLISLQAARGVRSHFNKATVFDSAVFISMGVAITYNTWLIWRVYSASLWQAASLQVSSLWLTLIRWGLFFWLLGSFMGAYLSLQLGHTVGAADGGAGLPLFGWSLVAGDLRIAHFFSLHGIHALGLVLLVLNRAAWAPSRIQKVLHVLAILWLVYCLGLFIEALIGHPWHLISGWG